MTYHDNGGNPAGTAVEERPRIAWDDSISEAEVNADGGGRLTHGTIGNFAPAEAVSFAADRDVQVENRPVNDTAPDSVAAKASSRAELGNELIDKWSDKLYSVRERIPSVSELGRRAGRYLAAVALGSVVRWENNWERRSGHIADRLDRKAAQSRSLGRAAMHSVASVREALANRRVNSSIKRAANHDQKAKEWMEAAQTASEAEEVDRAALNEALSNTLKYDLKRARSASRAHKRVQTLAARKKRVAAHSVQRDAHRAVADSLRPTARKAKDVAGKHRAED